MFTKNLFTIIFLAFFFQASFGELKKTKIQEIILIIDNSGSMKKNDHGFLVKQAGRNLIDKLNTNINLGIYLFDSEIKIIQPIISLSSEINRETCKKSLSNINYNGTFTDIPKVLEKAVYELKRFTDSNHSKCIILITDGFIDTGNELLDIDNKKWLMESLAPEANKARIKIFGIAFTENADFQLIQGITSRTNGEYYRALNPTDINSVLLEIIEKINITEKIIEQEVPITTKEELALAENTPGSSFSYYIIGILLLIGIILYMLIRKKPIKKPIPLSKVTTPSATLIDLDKTTDEDIIILVKDITIFGRNEENDIYLKNAENTVTGVNHAQIIFQDNTFFIKDLSKNFTKVNGENIKKRELFELKDGDIISIVKHRFQFKLPKIENGTEIYEIKNGSKNTIKESESSQQDEDSTYVKPMFCTNHPEVKPTDICTKCGLAFCNDCLIEKDDATVCVNCAKKI